MERGADFVVRRTLPELVPGMNELTGTALLDAAMEAEVQARDRELANPFGKDGQLTALHGTHKHLGNRLIRITKPHPLLGPRHGPLLAVRLHLLTRKSLGGPPLVSVEWAARLPVAGRHLFGRLPFLQDGGRQRSGGGIVSLYCCGKVISSTNKLVGGIG